MRVAALLALGLTGGCGSASALPSPPPTLSIEPSSGELVDVAEPRAAVPTSCTLSTKDYAASPQGWGLAFGDGRSAWGRLQPKKGGQAEVELEGARGETVAYRFSGDGVVLSGRAMASSVLVYARKPVWFEEIVLADPSEDLQWQQASGASVSLSIALGDEVEPSELSRSVSCDELALERPEIDVSALVDTDDLQTWTVDGDQSLPVFADADRAQPTVRLRLGDGASLPGGRLVAQRRRIVWERRGYTLVGWVPAGRLRLPTPGLGHGSGYGTGRGSLGAGAKRQRRDFACDERIELVVEHGGERAAVGYLEPERPWWVDDLEMIDDGWRPLHLDDDPVELRGNARWMIAVETLKGCAPL